MKLDMHLHSSYSNDGTATPREILEHARKIGLEGLCITDHNTMEGNREARRIAAEYGMIVVRGVEISSDEGHILAYGIDGEVEEEMSASDTVKAIRELGGMAVIPHPFRYYSGLGENVVRKICPDGIEVINGHSMGMDNQMARNLCEDMGLTMTAGSDGHALDEIGTAYIEIEDVSDEDGVLEAIRSEKVVATGKGRSLPGTLKDRTETVIQWMGRGFRKM